MAKGNNSKKGLNVKVVTVMMLMVLIVGCAIGGTVAWLWDQTENVTNTFSTSDISITLDEGKMNSDGLTINKDADRVTEDQDFKMIPGWTIEKDPKATVVDGSEKAWLFVKIVESANFDYYMVYDIADGWQIVQSETVNDDGTRYSVIGREIDGTDSNGLFGVPYSVLKGDKVTVRTEVTEKMMTEADNNQPYLIFTAYATQLMKDNSEKFEVQDAWSVAKANE